MDRDNEGYRGLVLTKEKGQPKLEQRIHKFPGRGGFGKLTYDNLKQKSGLSINAIRGVRNREGSDYDTLFRLFTAVGLALENDDYERRRWERSSNLEPEQREFIDEKLREEGLSIKAAATKYQVTEGMLRDALNGKDQDYANLEDIIDRLGVPDVNRLKERHRRLFNIPRERNDYFTGREDKMTALFQALERSRFAAVTQALSGLGGMGKTSTAIEYAYRCLDKANFPDYPRYKAIQFARADTVEVLKSGYGDIADRLQLRRADPKNLDQAVQAVIQWMTRPEEAPWLLILDNADDPDLLNEFLPTEPQRHYGHVLITSRSHRFAHRIKRVDIDAMDEEEGVTFLYRRTGRKRIAGSKEEQAARALVSEMGGLPLALEQAAAYMIHDQEMPFADYLLNFRDQTARSAQMKHAPEYGCYRQFEPETRRYSEALTVQTTWRISLANIQPHHLHAVQLLQFCAFLHPVGIPRELVIALLPDYFAPAGEDAVKQNALYNSLLNVLTGYSLIQRDLNNGTHNVHIMLQTVLRDEVQPEERKRAYEQILTAMMGSFPSDDWELGERVALYYPHAEQLRVYLQQNELEGEMIGCLLSRLGTVLYYQGRIAEAVPYFQRALAMRQKVLPTCHPDIAESLNDLALMYHAQNGFDEAEPLYQQALAMRQQAFPEAHPDVAESLNNLAELYNGQKRFTEAEPLYQQALAMRRKVFPEDHTTIANSLSNLAASYVRQKRFADAEVLIQEAIEIWQKVLPAGHPATAYSLTILAGLYRDQGRYADAEPLFQQVAETWQKGLPEGHPHIIMGLNNLARFYRDQGRYLDAELLFQKVLAMRRKALPEDHPDITESLNDLSEVYRCQGRLPDAEPL